MGTPLVIHFIFGGAARLMALKGHEDMFVTRSGSSLTLSEPRHGSFRDQRVSVHNRTLYFEEDGQRYSLVMFSRDIEVKIAKSAGERRVSFFSKKRSLDLFHLGVTPSEEKKPESAVSKAGTGKKRPKPKKTPRPSSGPVFLDPNEKFRVARPGPDVGTTGLDADGTPEIRPTAQRSGMVPLRNTTHSAEEPNVPTEEAELPRAQPIPRSSQAPAREPKFHVESDSSIDDGISYTIRNVRIMELDSEYFSLVSENNICVTYFENKFIFARCAKSEGQRFRLHNIENVKRAHGHRGGREVPRASGSLDESVAVPGTLLSIPEYLPQTPSSQELPTKGIQSPKGIAGTPFRRTESGGAVVNTDKALHLGLALDSDSLEYDLGRGAFSRENMLSKLKQTLEATSISEF